MALSCMQARPAAVTPPIHPIAILPIVIAPSRALVWRVDYALKITPLHMSFAALDTCVGIHAGTFGQTDQAFRKRGRTNAGPPFGSASVTSWVPHMAPEKKRDDARYTGF